MRKTLGVLAATSAAALLAACSSFGDDLPQLDVSKPEVLADKDRSGVDVSQRFFDNAPAAVVTGTNPADKDRATKLAVDAGVPLLTVTPETRDAVSAEIGRLGAGKVVAVDSSGEAKNVPLPGGKDVSIEDATSTDVDVPHKDHKNSFPPVLVTGQTSPAASATARAAGAELTNLAYPDPRVSKEASDLVKDKNPLALGSQFGSSEKLAGEMSMTGNGELPGGGELVFPGRRMIALYGHPSGPALGAMGEQDPQASVKRVQDLCEQYKQFAQEPVIPAFEIIATVAASEPGPDGNFTNESDVSELRPYVDAITKAGGYAVLDLQPGRGSFLEQAKLYEELLKQPNVGLALDPEWKIGPGEMPMQRVGSAEAAEINEASQWLSTLVRDNKLPQKALVIHQFQLQMLRDREQIDTNHPELAFVLHADGHGTTEEKFETWNVMRQDLDPAFFMAWKNFFDEDKPMFDPQQTMDVQPRPWFVSYQ
ncbi:hypothetical protein CHEID_10280 [Corynebacterium heidelbergense]|uniref:Cell wall-binding repeat 2 family protein n=2 Tax=Corynebacterium heidelbergense TaxID=2055947 RepID=A0A364V962_9CORY|nr:cell wall-binding repeat-containing protein [Corynebacterium heidelbergense]RAV33203.1 cell wall-binding repeat 2 family protein [Corynebacterium heidelbergense]WCZ37573.1 hypothetical protein CHEID_10280 [Corynebacterium heidelbergense]